MKKTAGILFLLISFFLLFLFFRENHNTVKRQPATSASVSSQPVPTVDISQNILFVPYWTLDNPSHFEKYQVLVYFGITPDENGINTSEDGYKNMEKFVQHAPDDMKTLLTVRMTDQARNGKILQDKNLQKKIIQESLESARNNSFDGIVLDLEYNALSFPDVIAGISDFSTDFAKSARQSNMGFYQTFFGDTFFRARPYNVGKIAKNTDGIFVMSYDFHKANGTPGPNFPLHNREDADYSFSQMLTDFAKVVPRDKILVVFGMFGYDWIIDEKGRPIKKAESISVGDIQKTFITSCPYIRCVVKRDQNTHEPFVEYTDTLEQNHIVWYEDRESVDVKKEVLRKNGISQIGFWANGYF